MTTYTWDASGRLLQVKTGSDSVTYAYNALGDLARRSTQGHVDRWFVWEAGQLVEELDSTAQHRVNAFAYLPGTDRPLARITGDAASTIEYVQQDGRGDVIGLTNGSAMTQHLLYGPWGNVEAVSGDSLPMTRLGWKGLVWEGGSAQLYYVRSRWYDPVSGSFLSEDPLGLSGGRNTYAYADNDPVNGWDPSGMSMDSPDCLITFEWKYFPETGDMVEGTLHVIAMSPECTKPAGGKASAASGGGGGGSDSRPSLLAVAKEVSRRVTPFKDAMDCLGHVVYGGAVTLLDAGTITELIKGARAGRASFVASREASSMAMHDLFAMNPGTGSAIQLAAADATATRGEALSSLGKARDEYSKGWPLAAFGLAQSPGLKGVAELIPGVGAFMADREAYQTCKRVSWR
ncbi:MAG: RHS repeat domain-containing protein [Gemmatimonadaceae bacterium]